MHVQARRQQLHYSGFTVVIFRLAEYKYVFNFTLLNFIHYTKTSLSEIFVPYSHSNCPPLSHYNQSIFPLIRREDAALSHILKAELAQPLSV